MIAKELSRRFNHYLLLMIGLSALCAIYVFSTQSQVRSALSVLIGLVYIAWGAYSHRGELQSTRLVLEYTAVGCLGAVILVIMAQIL